MDWLNENCGVIVLVMSIILIVLAALTVWLLFRLHNKIAVQRLNFLGFYSIEKQSKKRYAGLTIGNKSLNDVGLDELGIQNGKVNFPLTEKYREEHGLQSDARIVVEQRNSITFNLSCKDIRELVIDHNGKKVLHSLRLYAVDLTGTLYRGRIPAVKKLLKEMLIAEKKGIEPFADEEKTADSIESQPEAAPVTDEAAVDTPVNEPVPETDDNKTEI